MEGGGWRVEGGGWRVEGGDWTLACSIHSDVVHIEFFVTTELTTQERNDGPCTCNASFLCQWDTAAAFSHVEGGAAALDRGEDVVAGRIWGTLHTATIEQKVPCNRASTA